MIGGGGVWKTDKADDTRGLLQQRKHAVHRNKSSNLIETVERTEMSLIFYSSCFHQNTHCK